MTKIGVFCPKINPNRKTDIITNENRVILSMRFIRFSFNGFTSEDAYQSLLFKNIEEYALSTMKIEESSELKFTA